MRWGGYALAFATVLPGVLLTAEVLEALGVFRDVKGRAFNLGLAAGVPDGGGGAAGVSPGVALLYLPLIWGAFFFLLDPFASCMGGPSLIARFAAGERRQHSESVGRGADLRRLVGVLELVRHQ